ncbi:hypothetical protein CDAR_7141 [Caerostris darwini]|uniref:Uncharacterized protein n=1 Tax=Caerostris darwini TaxID=1538125 RepID=A0AAV4SIZ7_9ARAC|nr:hypothetical protein CDAR_7141 [Caerostris darwini]
MSLHSSGKEFPPAQKILQEILRPHQAGVGLINFECSCYNIPGGDFNQQRDFEQKMLFLEIKNSFSAVVNMAGKKERREVLGDDNRVS